MSKLKLRDEFKNVTGCNWKNMQDEPDIEYVEWLEQKLLDVSNSTFWSEKLKEAYTDGFSDSRFDFDTENYI